MAARGHPWIAPAAGQSPSSRLQTRGSVIVGTDLRHLRSSAANQGLPYPRASAAAPSGHKPYTFLTPALFPPVSGSRTVARDPRRTTYGFDGFERGTMEILWQDVRHAARTFLRNPAFTAGAVLTMALGIGGSTAIFSVVNAVLLRPLPFADGERLVRIQQTVARPDGGTGRVGVSQLNFAALRERSRVVES